MATFLQFVSLYFLPIIIALSIAIVCIAALLIYRLAAKQLAVYAYLRAVRKKLTPLMKVYYSKQIPLTYGANRDLHFLILGLPGAGKTKELERYQYQAIIHRTRQIISGQDRIPILIPLRYFDGFLLTRQSETNTAEVEQPELLFQYLLESSSRAANKQNRIHGKDEIVGISHLHNHLLDLAQEGRLLLLCDGLNELSPASLHVVCDELTHIMQASSNRVIMTCRELDFSEQDSLQQLVPAQQVETLAPLEQAEVIEFARHYLRDSKKHEQREAIIQQLHTTSLSYDYTNPFILVTLIDTLRRMDVSQRQNIRSRGSLLKISVEQLMAKEPIGPEAGFNEADVRSFLSEVACTARKNNQRNAIQLKKRAIAPAELQSILRQWLEENAPEQIILHKPYKDEMIPHYLAYAQKIGLLSISSHGVLSFKHELIAEYFVAEYLSTLYHLNPDEVPFWQDMFHDVKDVGTWSEPVAIWAGIEEDPMLLATRLVDWATRFNSQPEHQPVDMFNVLLISLSCYGVIWSSTATNGRNNTSFPDNIRSLLEKHMSTEPERQALALRFKRCADEGGVEVYRALLPFLNSIPGLDGLWLQLLQRDEQVVSHLLFDYLTKLIGDSGHSNDIQTLQKILGSAGKETATHRQESSFILDHAKRLSAETPENPLPLRVSCITILGYIQDTSTIEALIRYLQEPDRDIYGAAMNSLIQFEPEFTIDPLKNELQQATASLQHNAQDTLSHRILWCILQMLKSMLILHKDKLSLILYGNIIATITLFLSSNHTRQAQEEAKNILLLEVAAIKNQGDWRGKRVVDQLLARLDTTDEAEVVSIQDILRQTPIEATPQELEFLRTASTTARLRVIEVIAHVRDLRALHPLVDFLSSTPPLQEKVRDALRQYVHYRPDSISLLINELSSPQRSNAIAQDIASILEHNGSSGAPYIAATLLSVKPMRVHLLVNVLRNLGNKEAVPSLIALLQHTIVSNPNLAIYIIQMLADLPDERSVSPLLDLFASPETNIHTMVTQTLSKLGDIALPKLLLALDIQQETLTTQSLRTAIATMQPFPKERLMLAFKTANDMVAQHIMKIFQLRSSEEIGKFLVSHLFHTDERIRACVRKTLSLLPLQATAKSFVEALERPDWHTTIASYLHNRSEAIPFLVQALGHARRSQSAYDILLDSDSQLVIPHLIPGLENSAAQTRTKHLITTFVTRDHTLLTPVIHLFNPSVSGLSALPQQAHNALEDVLIHELGDLSLPELVTSLQVKELMNDCSETLVFLSRRPEKTASVLHALFDALADKPLRPGAEQTLIRIGKPALEGTTHLLQSQNTDVGASAQRILQKMGPLAFPVIHKLYHEDPAQQTSADTIFQGIASASLAPQIISYLIQNDAAQLEMGLYLLYKRIDDEDRSSKVTMLQEMLAQAQQASTTHIRVRILSALLLFNGSTSQRTSIANLIIAFLSGQAKYHKEFIHILPFLGEDAITPLKQVLEGSSPMPLREDAAGMLGLITRHTSIVALVDNLAKKQISAPGPRTRLFADPLQLRALGGLLASGNYDAQTLEHLANTHQSEASTEFYEVLLGVRNKPTVRSLNVQLDETRAELQSVNGQLTASINENEQLKTARRGLQREKDTLSEQLRTAQQQLLERNATISTLNTTINTLRVQLLAEQTRNRRPQPPNQFNRPTF